MLALSVCNRLGACLGGWRGVAFLCGAGVVTLGLGGAALAGAPAHPLASVPASRATVLPRLIVTPRVVALTAWLSGGVRLRGTLFPALPGPNALHVLVRDGAGNRVRGGQVRLVVTMPGMRMRPVSATLAAHGDGYSGMLALPMFGRYRAQVVAALPGGHDAGTLTLDLPLGQW